MKLTKSEKEITILIYQCLTNLEIGNKLGVSKRTVETHLNNLYKKLHIHNRIELLAIAKSNPGIFKADTPVICEIKFTPKRRKRETVKKLKAQRLKAALIASSMVDYISSDYIKSELNKLLVALRP